MKTPHQWLKELKCVNCGSLFSATVSQQWKSNRWDGEEVIFRRHQCLNGDCDETITLICEHQGEDQTLTVTSVAI